jgi:uncharacterized protein (DUF111 family)
MPTLRTPARPTATWRTSRPSSGSGLDAAIQDSSLPCSGAGEAEARVHATTVDQIHFHEVGATDALVDIVGAAICRHLLDVDAVWASPVELGGGFVRCAHGVIPVPAPATVEILRGIPTTRGAVRQETTTPTGATILAALVDEFSAVPALVGTNGSGIGTATATSNVLRLSGGPTAPAAWTAKRPSACNMTKPAEMSRGMDTLGGRGQGIHFSRFQ